MRDVTTQGPRENVLGAIAATPGIHTRALARSCGLALRTARYHVDHLARAGRIAIHVDGRYRRLFIAGEEARKMEVQAALMRRIPRAILLLLMDGKTWSRRDLAEVSGVAGSTLGGGLVHLVRRGILERELRGGSFLYHARDPELVRSLVRERGVRPDLAPDVAPAEPAVVHGLHVEVTTDDVELASPGWGPGRHEVGGSVK